jgi:2,4-dienoyl-CoA reductase (NADPH2)
MRTVSLARSAPSGRLRTVQCELGTEATAEDLTTYDEVVLATGVVSRDLDMLGSDHPKVVSYTHVLDGSIEVGK